MPGLSGLSHINPLLSPLPFANTEIPSPWVIGTPRISPSNTEIYPSDSVSNVSSRSRSALSYHPGFPGHRAITPDLLQLNLATNTWNSEKQRDFEDRIGRITASAQLPFTWIQNPEVVRLFDLLAPQVTIPSRYKLARTIIPRLAQEFREKVKISIDGGYGTLQADGWTAINYHHMVAFMATVNRKVRHR